ncbi:MAG: excinuclease ABC subunit UvrB [Phycisphaeraceae bacterium]|nr:excinuclease ABC subunit UvrB [Phycisphaeraceae bacterium]MCB9847403.1 excinuclease ABC subunit UvrB [Phycisphaeraceae bacterium]
MTTRGKPFEIVSEMTPRGDQPQAIDALVGALGDRGERAACLLGATGTGKTFTMANVIERLQRPTLIISHNKTLAAQLYEEMRELFPRNAVCYFVSYYDYYQPEAYIPQRDIYIEKDASRNDDLDRLRLAATSSLLSRNDVIVVASVSCIFGLGSPEVYGDKVMPFLRGATIDRRALFLGLTDMQYERGDAEFVRGRFRVRGDTVEVWPAYEKFGVRLEMFDDEIESIHLIDPVSGETIVEEERFFLYPAVHYVMPEDELERALSNIKTELEARVLELRSQGKLLEAQRLLARTRYDMEMMDELGFCSGIENYSRHLDGRAPGETPFTLLDYFDWTPGWTRATRSGPGGKRPWLCMIDESHVSLPQIRAMFNGDRARKEVLVDHGFRLPSAIDNRPLRFEEFESVVQQTLYVSATPGPYELEQTAGEVVEQIIRPTGLVDPTIEVLPARTQVPDLIERCQEVVDGGERVLVTALTKRLCEQLAEHLDEKGLRVRYLHSDIETLDRIEILRALREGEFDVLVGVNLLREGLDLPEVSLVCILDADKEGFLRSPTSLIQQMGRAARNVNAHVIMYADKVTKAMTRAMDETQRRREKQLAYNEANGITPTQIVKAIRMGIESELKARRTARQAVERSEPEFERDELLRLLEEEMLGAAEALDFESAASLRDQIQAIENDPDLAVSGGKLTRSEAEKAAEKGPSGKRTAPGAAGTRPRSRKKARTRRRD